MVAIVLRSHIATLASQSFKTSLRGSWSVAAIFQKTRVAYPSISTTTSARLHTAQSLGQVNTASTMATPESGTMPGPPTDISDKDIAVSKKETEPELPKLSMEDFRVYNRLAVMMNAYHNHFRYTWNMLYKACESGTRPNGMSIRSFISQGLHLCQALTVHHTIEEQYVFPELAERMPAFGEHDHLITQHEAIHEGLVKLEEYLDACRSGERELRMPELKEVMDTFGEVLWSHLDDEVRMLGAENMRKFWSKQEILAMNW
ncbi:hypothetical protein LTR10_023170 [Elasticomyces elasticus]|nr:hypothetical protein LTR10_023170 [Elasticomyces elasticus]KAK5041994.1 hypothetical protein LTR13_001800 [Exophiala sideris]KAK5185262.1 hypothetical protein LTR44_002251 [Eurotiomycetes sp. CCFEE 6388]